MGVIYILIMLDVLFYIYDDIVQQVIDVVEVGVLILYLYVCDNEIGVLFVNLDDFVLFLLCIKQVSDVVINILIGGFLILFIQDCICLVVIFSVEMCFMNMGSMNFFFYLFVKCYDSWKFDWEKDYVVNLDGNIFWNMFKDICEVVEIFVLYDIKFEYECYDVGYFYNLKFCMDMGFFKVLIFIQFVMGIFGGIGVDIDNLVFMKKIVDKLFGDDYCWLILVVGNVQIFMVIIVSQMGGNVCVGLEDSLFISCGQLVEFNVQQVVKICWIVEEFGSEVVIFDEVCEILDLKGGDCVVF